MKVVVGLGSKGGVSPKTAMKTHHFFCDEVLTSMPTWKLVLWKILVTKVWMFHKCKLCMHNDLKCFSLILLVY